MTSIKFALNNYTTDAYEDIFKNSIPLLDVRAPIEFNKGSFANATNIPILDDLQRQKVGSHFKNKGQNSAIDLGFALVTKEQKHQRFTAWRDWHLANPNGFVYCFRGGLRSKLTQDFLYKEYQIKIPRVAGGYKALRKFMLDSLEASAKKLDFFLLGGKTGSGKTILLDQLADNYDLEAAAAHLGSAFGNVFVEQPSQINFEHKLAEFLINYQSNRIIFEDESRNIGRCQIPQSIFNNFKQAKILVLEIDLHQRVKNILQQYVIDIRGELIHTYGEELGIEKFNNARLKSLQNIQTKLGLEKFKQLEKLLQAALEDLNKSSMALMQEFIATLLLDYYDPMYEWQLSKKQDRILIRGDFASIKDFWQNLA